MREQSSALVRLPSVYETWQQSKPEAQPSRSTGAAAYENPSGSLTNDDFEPPSGPFSLLGTLRFLFVSVAAMRVQAQPPQLSAFAHGIRYDMPSSSLTGLQTSDCDSNRPLNVLCLDGGGIRGRNLMVMVSEIEAACGRPISEMFDLIAGTSIGGCGALFLSKFQEEAVSRVRCRREAPARQPTACLTRRTRPAPPTHPTHLRGPGARLSASSSRVQMAG